MTWHPVMNVQLVHFLSHTTNWWLLGFIGSEPRPPWLVDLGPLLLSSIRGGIAVFNEANKSIFGGETCPVEKQMLWTSQVWNHIWVKSKCGPFDRKLESSQIGCKTALRHHSAALLVLIIQAIGQRCHSLLIEGKALKHTLNLILH